MLRRFCAPRKPRAAARRGSRPSLEILEDRTVPAASGAQLLGLAAASSLDQTAPRLQQAQAAAQSDYARYQQDQAALNAGTGGVTAATVNQDSARLQADASTIRGLSATYQNESYLALFSLLGSGGAGTSAQGMWAAYLGLKDLMGSNSLPSSALKTANTIGSVNAQTTTSTAVTAQDPPAQAKTAAQTGLTSSQGTTAVQDPPATTTTATSTSTSSATTATSTGTVSSATTSTKQLVSLNLNPINVNELGLQLQTSPIQVTLSAQPGQGQLLGNALSSTSTLVDQGVNNALNKVLASTVSLLNSGTLSVSGSSTTGPLSNAPPSTTPILTAFIAPVQANVEGVLVNTSPITVTLTAQAGQGQILGNALTDVANLFNPPLSSQLDVNTINTGLENIINELNQQFPNIPGSPVSTPTIPPGSSQVLSLSVPPINLNLLGLNLLTSQIQVNADAQTGNGELLGNLATGLLNTLGATPQNLTTLNDNLNTLLGKVVGVLNASNLTLPQGAVNALPPVVKQLVSPTLVNPTVPASTSVLNLAVATNSGNSPPVNVNLLGLNVTTSNVQVQLNAQTGQNQVLGNLLYNVSNLDNPGNSPKLLAILAALSA